MTGPRDSRRRTQDNRWPGLGRGADLGLCGLAMAMAVIAGSLILALTGGGPGPVALLAAGGLGFAVGVFLLLHLRAVLRAHLQALERLRGAMVTLAASDDAVLPLPPAEADFETARLHASLADLSTRIARQRTAPDRRLEAVVQAIADAILVITDQGQVSLVNTPAKALLGAERVRVGTSVFAALRRDPVVRAMKTSESRNRIVATTFESVSGARLDGWVSALGEHGGAVLVIPIEASRASELAASHRAGLEHDLGLHDVPPPATAVTPETPLEALPVLVLDTETTGLDVTADRIVSIGAVRLHGTRIYRSRAFDRLVNPSQPIPSRSTAIHGITDAMVVDADPFPAVFEDLQALAEGAVIVGHNVPFDLAMLRRECRLAGIDWEPPACLDTLAMAVAQFPDLASCDLEGLAERFGVDIHGRHTALGDSLVTARIYARLVPQLIAQGITTLGQAQEAAARAGAIVARQKEAGW